MALWATDFIQWSTLQETICIGMFYLYHIEYKFIWTYEIIVVHLWVRWVFFLLFFFANHTRTHKLFKLCSDDHVIMTALVKKSKWKFPLAKHANLLTISLHSLIISRRYSTSYISNEHILHSSIFLLLLKRCALWKYLHIINEE